MLETGVTEEEQKNILNQLIFDESEEIIRINPKTKLGTTIHAISDKWQKTMGISFPFEETMRSFLLSFATDAKTKSLMISMNMEHIEKHLEENQSYKLYYIIQNDKSSFQIKKASFFKKNPESIWLIIRDVTDDYKRMTGIIDDLNYALKKTTGELDRKNTFLKLMNRNIRTPLYSIMGLTQITEENTTNNTSLNAYLHKISMSGTYMNDTIDDILELRRIADREIELKPEAVRMQDFIQYIQEKAEPLCQDKGLLFSLKSTLSHNLVVEADLHALKQIVMKLLQSAMNYTVTGGRIQLNADELILDTKTVTIDFSVNCAGLVIDKERLKTLFQPYDFLMEKIDEDIGSLDMALIILKRYALAMGTDTLIAESDERIGTKVSLTLTLDLSEDTKTGNEESIDELLPKLCGLKVLVVDDNDTNLEVSKKILDSKGIKVQTALNGKEAIDIFKKENGNFDLIIMDILMPVMDGLETTRKIRALTEIKTAENIPIIAMTANSFRESFEESIQAGMNAHLVKPINQERLFRVMADVIPAGPSENFHDKEQ